MAGRQAYRIRKMGPNETHNKHRRAFPFLAQEVIRISDVILQVLDARFLEETRNPELEKMVKDMGKILVNVLNKVDLVDLRELRENQILVGLEPYVLFSSSKRIGLGKLRERIKISVKKFIGKHNKAHVGVIGYPNTGKSSLINSLSGRSKSGTAAEAGFTKGIQKIRFSKDILILDTPGVIPDKENSRKYDRHLKKHTMIGAQTYNKVRDPDLIVNEIMQKDPELLEDFYGIESKGDSEVFLEKLGKRRNFLKKGGAVDIDRAARVVLKDWQEGKIVKGKDNN